MMNDDYINNILESITSGVALYEYTGDKLNMVYCNTTVCKMLGYSRERFVEMCSNDAFFCVFSEDIAKLSESLRLCISGGFSTEREVRFVKRDKTIVWIKCSSKLLGDDNSAQRIVMTFTDITEEIISKEELSFRANHDDLTSIFNANAFYQKTQEMLNENPNKEFVLVRLNIVKFKVINDVFGTKIADNILISAARFLEKVLSDRTAAYGRITSDHFAFCLSADLFDQQELEDTILAFSRSFPEYYNLSFKAGIYQITDKAISVAVMCDRAKLAMQTIKNDTSRLVAYYNDEIRQNMLMEQRIESEMQWALDNEQFEVWFQPIYSLTSMQPYSAEALVRWRHPTKGLISPGKFIPVFEKNGFIRKLDSYVFEHVCAYIRRRLDNGQYLVPISVNISRMSLYSEDLSSEIIGVVEKYGLTPDLFKIEITETAYNNYPQILLNTINKLRAYGFTILMDDFGSGYSSLNTLKDLPIDVLKIDMNFMSDFSVSDKATNILASIVRMAKWLDMPCIAEGVETEIQVDFLKSIGCENIQGFYFSRPLPQEDFEKVIDMPAAPAHGDQGKSIEALSEDVDAMLTGNQTVTRLMNGLFGAMGFYEFSGDNLEVIRVNDGYYRMLGYSLTEFARDAKNILGKLYPGDIEALKNAIRQSSDTKKAVHTTFRRYDAKGNLLYLDASVNRFGGTNEKQLICIAFNDITEHIMLEKKSSEKTNLLNFIARRLLEQSDIDHAINDLLRMVRKYFRSEMSAAFSIDKNDREYFTFYESVANKHGKSVCTAEKIPFSACEQFFDLAGRNSLLKIDNVDGNELFTDKTRSILLCRGINSLMAIPVFNGEDLIGVLCVGNPRYNLDQTDFLQAISYYFSLAMTKYRIQMVSESYNSQMNAIIANMNGGVGLFDISSDDSMSVSYVSDNFRKIANISSDIQLSDLASIADQRDRDALEAKLGEAIKHRSSMIDQFRISNNGEEKWVSLSCSVVPDPKTGSSIMVAVINDVTRRVKEEEIRYSEALSSVFDRIYRIDMSLSSIELLSGGGKNDLKSTERFIDTFGSSEEMVKQRKWLAKMCKQAYVDHVYGCEHYDDTDGDIKWLELLFVKLTAAEYLMCVLDVTQKKKTESLVLENEKLRLQEQFHESESIYVHQTGVVIIEYDYATRRAVATDNVKELAVSDVLNDPVRMTLRGMNMDMIAHPDDSAKMLEMFEANENYAPIEFRLRKKNGEYIWVQMTKTVIQDENGKPVRAGYTIIDINSRKLSEEKLKRVSDMMSNIVSNANSGIVLFEIGGDDNDNINVVFTNDAYYSIVGYRKDSYKEKGLDLTKIICNFDSERIQNALANKISTGRSYTTEVMINSENGSNKWLKLDFAPYITSEGLADSKRIIMIATDITDIKDTSQRLSTILAKAGNGISMFEVHDDVFKLVYANQQFLRLNGYESTEDINAIGGVMELVHPEDKPKLFPLVAKAIDEGVSVECDYRIIIKDGGIRWRHVNATPIQNIFGEKPLLLAIYTDITDIKEISERFESVIKTIPGIAAYYKIRGYRVISEYYVPNAQEICEFDDAESFGEFKDKVREDARFITPLNRWEGLVKEARSLSLNGGRIVLKNVLSNGKNTPVIMYGLTTPDISDGLPAINLILIVPPKE